MSNRPSFGLGATVSLLLLPALALPVAAAPHEFSYVSPLPGSRMVSPWNNVAIRPGGILNSLSLDAASLTVVGSRSGAHGGRLVLASDERTIVFTPDQPYTLGETVHVRLSPGVRTAAGAALPELSYEFQVSRVDPRRMPHADREELLGSDAAEARMQPAAPAAITSAGPCDTLLPSFPYVGLASPNSRDPGSYFMAPFPSGTQTAAHYAILDDWGEPVYERTFPGASLPTDFKVQKNGLLTFWMDGAYKFYGMDSAYAIVDSFTIGNGYFTDLHDLQILPNGHLLMMSYDPEIVGMDTVVAGGNPNATVLGLIVQEMDENRNVIFQWRSWDHFKITDGSVAAEVNLQGARIDYVHGNSVELCPDGNLLISCRHMNELTKIDRQTGTVMWRMGRNAVNNQFAFPNDTRGFSHQHDARVLPNGHVTLYDNGNGLSPLYSRALEFELDEENLVATLVWQYRHVPDVYGGFMGNVQRHADGSTTIGWGGTFGSPKSTDLNADGTIQAEVLMPLNHVNYRTFRSPWRSNRFLTDAQSIAIGSPGPGNPRSQTVQVWNHWNQPISLTCARTIDQASFGTVLGSGSVPVTLAPGETTTVQVIYDPQGPDTVRSRLYIMQVSDNELVAQSVSIEGHIDPTLAVGDVSPRAASMLAARAHPNPFRSRTAIHFSLPASGRVILGIYDVHGRLVASLLDETRAAGQHTVTWDPGPSAAGLYFCRLSAGGKTATCKLVRGT